jgi:O-antigen/teichoic acid export membrane protein
MTSIVPRVRGAARWVATSTFVRDAASMTAVNLAAEVVLLAAIPALASLAGPAEYGRYAFFLALTTFFGTLGTGLYDWAILSAKQRVAEVVTTGAVVVCFACAVAIGLLSILARLIDFGRFADTTAVALTLLPLAIFATLLLRIDRAVAQRRHQVLLMAVFDLLRVAAMIGAQAAALVVGLPQGLMVGHAAGVCFAAVVATAAFLSPHAILKTMDRPYRMLKVLIAYRRFPLQGATGFALGIFSVYVAAMSIGAIYGAAAAGMFFLAERMVGVPVRIIQSSTGQVSIARLSAALRAGRPLRPYIRRLLLGHAAVALVLPVGVALLGPALVSRFFSQEWTGLAGYLVIVTPVYVARLMANAGETVFIAAGRPSVLLAFEARRAAGAVAWFAFCWAASISLHACVIGYSIFFTLWYASLVVPAWAFRERANETRRSSR